MRLLLLEDDVLLGEGLRDFLRAEGHVVDWCCTIGQAQGLRGEIFDALLLDWQLPDGSGLDWLKSQRARGDATPALMITARDLLHDRLDGFDSGADDYLVKPFAPEELAARVRAVGRRLGGSATGLTEFGAVQIHLGAKSCCRDGQRIDLTAREWAVLEALAIRAGRIVPKSELEQIMLGFDSEVASNALEVHVSSIRRKLGRALIDTVRGLGYRMNKA